MTSPRPQPESAVEAYLTRRVKALGGLSFKLAPTHAGLPDRLLFLPGGFMYLVEVKALGGAVSPIQHLVHQRIGQVGTPVHVVWGTDGVDRFMRDHLDRACLL